VPGQETGPIAFSSEVGTGSHSNQARADCVDLSAQKTRQNKN